MTAPIPQPQPMSEEETRKVPVLVPDPNSASGRRVEWLSIEIDGDLAKVLDSCAVPSEDVFDKARAWDVVAGKNTEIYTLKAKVEGLEEAAAMARTRCNAALMGEEPCKPCIELAISYLDAVLQPNGAA